jgi:sugar fermentation stimulation protein A
MKFHAPLVRGTLLQRYKRFLADIELEDGTVVTAHCANPGSMLGLKEPGLEAWIAPAANENRKLKWDLELLRVDGHLVGINTNHPNKLAAEAIEAGRIAELTGYAALRREVKYGENSRVDILLEDADRPPCYVEIKNVHLKRDTGVPGLAEFPDAVTARGAKHLRELANVVTDGGRAVMFYLVQRVDCDRFTLANDIDPVYANAFREARAAGVEAICYACDITTAGITVAGALPLDV